MEWKLWILNNRGSEDDNAIIGVLTALHMQYIQNGSAPPPVCVPLP